MANPIAPQTSTQTGAQSGLRTLLLGGSFNPAHRGHRRITLSALSALGLDEAWWLVSPGNPLKDPGDMAPLARRYASARGQARRAPIRVTALEREFGTRFTVDTLSRLKRRWPKRRFIWLMGADNLAQLHRWKDWRKLARLMPIAVVARPGYDGAAIASPAMAWLGRFRKPVASLHSRARWSAPALLLLRFDPDPSSASALRELDPGWSVLWGDDRIAGASLRDTVTHRLIRVPFYQGHPIAGYPSGAGVEPAMSAPLAAHGPIAKDRV